MKNIKSINIKVTKKYDFYDPITALNASFFFSNSSLILKNAIINEVYLLNQSLIETDIEIVILDQINS
jgi:hypothetical protein